ncbi:MAG: hypothetical protein QOJ64_3766 [Acidobacteriota bacterium]|jgi:VWFA-related protein|nr:hypothetical protein [Acidobacteriota bacterium]
MNSSILSLERIIASALLCISSVFTFAYGQDRRPSEPDNVDVLRIDTELIQTGVTVVDKQGRFVDGLTRDQFVLRVDGKAVEPLFFDRITAGTPVEEARIAAAATGKTPERHMPPARMATASPGRTIVFFVDDLHLSLDSLGRTRRALTHFIENEMTPNDRVAFTSASGQIGFLQKLTDNKAVLRAALARINPVPYVVLDRDQPPMTEFIAIKIANGDREARDFYAEELFRRSFRNQRGITREAFYETVKNRANQILVGLENVTSNSLGSLENLLRTMGTLRGRKLVFVISDGFYLESKNTIGAGNDRLRHVIDVATRTGSVIYTIDARGLFAAIPDASGDRPFDPSGRLDRASVGETVLSQDGLNALAGDTGGRFLKNQNYFEKWVAQMLEETSNYYLLAWRPDTDEQKGANYKHIEVSIAGRPELTVRLPRGFYHGKSATRNSVAAAPKADSSTPATSATRTDEELREALGSYSSRGGLPTVLSVSFVDVPNTGPVLSASMQMSADALDYGADGKQPATIDVAGVVLDDHGKQSGGFKTRVNVNPMDSNEASGESAGVIYNHKLPLKPGLYQVRVASRDAKSGRVGSAAQWIEVPDLTSGRLMLSSLLIGGQRVRSSQTKAAGETEQVQFSVDRRFKRDSHLSILTIIYNAARDYNGRPDLEAQLQISRDGKPVITGPTRKVAVDSTSDITRIPYGADIALQKLSPGRYVLEVKINDRRANSTATQLVTLDIE